MASSRSEASRSFAAGRRGETVCRLIPGTAGGAGGGVLYICSRSIRYIYHKGAKWPCGQCVGWGIYERECCPTVFIYVYNNWFGVTVLLNVFPEPGNPMNKIATFGIFVQNNDVLTETSCFFVVDGCESK